MSSFKDTTLVFYSDNTKQKFQLFIPLKTTFQRKLVSSDVATLNVMWYVLIDVDEKKKIVDIAVRSIHEKHTMHAV